MRLQLSTWPEVETYLDTSKGVIIPVGSTEQHGPTGFIGTDALCPEILAFGRPKARISGQSASVPMKPVGPCCSVEPTGMITPLDVSR